MKIDRLTKETFGSIQDSLLKRSANSYPKQEAAVAEILENVKKNGDKAVFEYEKKFDHCELTADNIRVTPEEEEEAYKLVDPELVGVIQRWSSASASRRSTGPVSMSRAARRRIRPLSS